MPIITTLAMAKEFEYTNDGNGLFFIEYAGRPHITAVLIAQIQQIFQGKEIIGGFSETEPMADGFGEWLQNNTQFTPRQGSHIAAVLFDLGVILSHRGHRPVYLQF